MGGFESFNSECSQVFVWKYWEKIINESWRNNWINSIINKIVKLASVIASKICEFLIKSRKKTELIKEWL